MAARFLLRPTRFLEENARRYGGLFTFELTEGRVVVACADPAVIKRVFTGDPAQFLAGEGNVVLKPLLGPRSVLLLDGPEHLRQRRLLLPPFHGDRMRAYGEAMREIAERHVARWPIGTPFPVHRTMQSITLDVILRTVFGIEEPGRSERLGEPLRRLLDSTVNPWRLLLLQLTRSEGASPRSPWGRIRAMVAAADEMIYAEIDARRRELAAGGSERDDILTLLLSARDEDGEPMTDGELRDELMTLLAAGHETTATALAWTLERLVRHPAVLARAQAEVRDGGAGEYLDAVVKETLRLRPVVPAVIRKLTAPFEVGPWTLPAGVHIAPSIFLTQRRPDIYPDPLAFRPERFLDGDAPGTYEWLPFGGGIRRCLGASFALYEMRIVLETVLRRATLVPTGEPSEPVARRAITFTPGRGGRVQISELRPATRAGAPRTPAAA